MHCDSEETYKKWYCNKEHNVNYSIIQIMALCKLRGKCFFLNEHGLYPQKRLVSTFNFRYKQLLSQKEENNKSGNKERYVSGYERYLQACFILISTIKKLFLHNGSISLT